MVGLEDHDYHLEFTSKHGHDVGKAPTEDNLLVFYLEDEKWAAAVDRIERAGYGSVQSFNPWWNAHGKTYEDADGYRVVLWKGGWVNRKRESTL